jgi:hypothetical protein
MFKTRFSTAAACIALAIAATALAACATEVSTTTTGGTPGGPGAGGKVDTASPTITKGVSTTGGAATNGGATNGGTTGGTANGSTSGQGGTTSGSGQTGKFGHYTGSLTGDKARIGQTVAVGDWSIKVPSVPQPRSAHNNQTPRSGFEFLVMDVVLQNKGKKAAKLQGSDFKLVRDDGTIFPAVPQSSNDWVDHMLLIKPGDRTTLGLIYEVPVDMNLLNLVIQPKGTAKPTIIMLR